MVTCNFLAREAEGGTDLCGDQWWDPRGGHGVVTGQGQEPAVRLGDLCGSHLTQDVL